MTKPTILAAKRPTHWSDAELVQWDRNRRAAEERWGDFLHAKPLERLTDEDWQFLESLPEEIPI